jgi:uracil-DNA glycosylase
MIENSGRMPDSWFVLLKEEMNNQNFKELKKFISEERSKFQVFPPSNQIFNAFILTPPDEVKVVILGQDPYHGFGQAHGLAFSVPENTPFPPSLRNIFQELQSDLNTPHAPSSGNLTSWAKQGVFLLNTALTVRSSEANSHQNRGWEKFTDSVIKTISDKKKNIAFVLWGRNAQSKEKLIDSSKHLILKSAHPSPLSAYRGFFASKPFSKINRYLEDTDQESIQWLF